MKNSNLKFLMLAMTISVISLVNYQVFKSSYEELISAKEINESGRQRLLATRIVMHSYHLLTSVTKEKLSEHTNDIIRNIKKLTENHKLISFDHKTPDADDKFQKKLYAMYFNESDGVDSQINNFVANINKFVSLTKDTQAHKIERLRLIDHQYKILVSSLDNIVSVLQQQNEDKLKHLNQRLLYVVYIVMIVLILSWLFIIIPLNKYNDKLNYINNKQLKQIQRTEKLRNFGAFSAGVTHDINNILSVISGYSSLLNKQFSGNEKISSYLSEILKAEKRAADLTQKLLSFSKESKNILNPVKLSTILSDNVQILKSGLTSKIKLELDIDSNVWPILSNVGDIEDLLLNMTINASHAIKEHGRVTVHICNHHFSLANKMKPPYLVGDFVVLRITDNGCGMSEDTINHIFDPFFTTKGKDGTGLGLSQVFNFVEKSKGKIEVFSEVGKGSQFIIHFPRYIS